MTRARPSVFTAFVLAYWDLFHAMRAMWRSALIAVVILSAGAFTTAIVPLLLTRNLIVQPVLRQAFLIALCFLLTPFLLAIHRFVLLGEVPTRYRLDPTRRRFQLVFGWLAVSAFLAGVPSFLEDLAAARDPFYEMARAFDGAGPSTLVWAARLAVFTTVHHLLVLFPAVAVDAPGATWQNALRDTHDHIWFAIAVTFLPFIPIGLLGVLVAPLLRVGNGTLIGVIVGMLWLGACFLVALTLVSVIAARLYQAVGDRLKMPVREA
jgi:hypothetical protein